MREKKERILEEQKAPLKNTDHAFVRVNKDGSPELSPASEGRQRPKEKQDEQRTRRRRP
jgi:hypothetical protein